MKKHKTITRLLSALMVLLLLFPLSACAPAEPYGIYVGMSGNEYCATVPADLAIDRWINTFYGAYETFENESGDIVVVERSYISETLPDGRIVGGDVRNIFVYEPVTPRSVAYLQEHLYEGMPFPEMIGLAGLPKVRLKPENRTAVEMIFPTDGDELLRTKWETWSSSLHGTLEEFSFFLPDTTTNPYGIYEGMPEDECFGTLRDHHADSWESYMLMMYTFINQDGNFTMVKCTDDVHPENYVEEIYVFEPVAPKSEAYLYERIQLGMTIFEVIEIAGFPTQIPRESNGWTLIFPTDDGKSFYLFFSAVESEDGNFPVEYVGIY